METVKWGGRTRKGNQFLHPYFFSASPLVLSPTTSSNQFNSLTIIFPSLSLQFFDLWINNSMTLSEQYVDLNSSITMLSKYCYNLIFLDNSQNFILRNNSEKQWHNYATISSASLQRLYFLNAGHQKIHLDFLKCLFNLLLSLQQPER